MSFRSSTRSPSQPAAGRQHLCMVRTGGLPPALDFLPPGATWLPAPGDLLPAGEGGAPMVGYLVLVPVEDQSPAAARPPVTVDPGRRVAQVAGRVLDLTYLEFELLAHLVAQPHRVHTRDQLVTTVWGYGHVGDGRTVDVHIARLRRKLGPDHRGSIVTVRRVGYKYAPPADR